MGSTERTWLRSWWVSGSGEDGFPVSDLNIRELSGGEDLLAAGGRGLSDLEGEKPRIGAHSELEVTGFPFFLAKRTGSMVGHKTSKESRNLYTCSPSVCRTARIGSCRRAWPPSARRAPGGLQALATRARTVDEDRVKREAA